MLSELKLNEVGRRSCTDQQDAGPQVRVRRPEQEAAAGLQQRARHLDVVMGEIRQQHLLGHIKRVKTLAER